jgi:hypothetical protein
MVGRRKTVSRSRGSVVISRMRHDLLVLWDSMVGLGLVLLLLLGMLLRMIGIIRFRIALLGVVSILGWLTPIWARRLSNQGTEVLLLRHRRCLLCRSVSRSRVVTSGSRSRLSGEERVEDRVWDLKLT